MFDIRQSLGLIFVKVCLEQVSTDTIVQEALDIPLPAIEADPADISLLHQSGQEDGSSVLLDSKEVCDVLV